MLTDTPVDHPNAVKVPSYGAGGTPTKRRRPGDAAKLGLHTTQTAPGTGRTVARQLKSAYTLLVEIEAREALQCLPLNWTSHALKGGSGNEETNHSGRMHPQIAFVGYAENMHLLTAGDLNWIADIVIAPILALCEIENKWVEMYGADDDIGGPPWLASAGSAVRLSYADFYRFGGVYGHQHAPAPNDHWDPGKLNAGYLRARIANGGAGPNVAALDAAEAEMKEAAEWLGRARLSLRRAR